MDFSTIERFEKNPKPVDSVEELLKNKSQRKKIENELKEVEILKGLFQESVLAEQIREKLLR